MANPTPIEASISTKPTAVRRTTEVPRLYASQPITMAMAIKAKVGKTDSG